MTNLSILEHTVSNPIQRNLSTWSNERLIAEVNGSHSKRLTFRAKAVDHAIRCGHALNELHTRIPRGEWKKWCKQNIQIAEFQYRVYMRLARHEGLVREHEVTSIKSAARLIARTGENAPRHRIDPTLIAEANRLRNEGMTYAAIGREMGMTGTTVRRYVGENAKRDNERMKTRYKEQRRLLIMARNEQRRRFAKAKGGYDLSAAYEHVRKALERLEAASIVEQSANARQSINTAIHRIYEGEDAIIKAIGTSSPAETSK